MGVMSGVGRREEGRIMVAVLRLYVSSRLGSHCCLAVALHS